MDGKVSFIKFNKFLILRLRSGDVLGYAYHLTYNLLLSFFPFLIFLTTLVGYADLDSSAVLTSLEIYLPKEAYILVSDIVIDVMNNQRDGLMSFSMVLAIFFASGGFRSFMEASNRAMDIHENRNIFLRYLMSVIGVILLALAIIFALLGIVFGRQIVNSLERDFRLPSLNGVLQVLGIIIPELIIFLLILSFYIFVPAKKVCIRCAIPGAAFSTLIWTGSTFLFQFYINNYANYSKFYGALGAVIILLLWLLLTSYILLVGFEINALLMKLNITHSH